MKRLLLFLLIAGIAWAASPARAQKLTDIRARAQLSANGGGLWFTEAGGGKDNWQGAGLGGALTYSVHKQLAVYGALDHGFPFADSDGHQNFARVVANLKVYPNGPEPSDNAIFIGFGRGWFGSNVGDRVTNDAQIVVAHKFRPRLSGGILYAHAFGRENEPDFDFVKLALNTRWYP